MLKLENLPQRHGNVPLRVCRGHFATNHSHINIIIDVAVIGCEMTTAHTQRNVSMTLGQIFKFQHNNILQIQLIKRKAFEYGSAEAFPDPYQNAFFHYTALGIVDASHIAA